MNRLSRTQNHWKTFTKDEFLDFVRWLSFEISVTPAYMDVVGMKLKGYENLYVNEGIKGFFEVAEGLKGEYRGKGGDGLRESEKEFVKMDMSGIVFFEAGESKGSEEDGESGGDDDGLILGLGVVGG
jgi:hypothetical protein